MVTVSRTLKTKKADHFPAVVTTLSKSKKLNEILGKLTKTQRRLFKQSCFGHFLDLQSLGFSGNLVHKILLHEVETDGDEQEMWFLVGEMPMRFSRMEFALITGLRFGTYPDVDVDSHRLKDLYFGLKPSPTLDDIDIAFHALDFTSIDDVDAAKVMLYYLLERVVIGRAGRYLADLWLMSLVDDLDEFNRYPWGSVSWRYTYRSLSRALRGQAGQYRVKKAEAEAEGKTYSTKYNVDGFPLAFQPLVVLQHIDPSEEERTQPYYTQVVGLVGVDEGEYGGTILMDDPTLGDADEAPGTSAHVAPGTADFSTPDVPAADPTADQSAATSPIPARPKKRSRPRRPSRHTEYREELFPDDDIHRDSDTRTQPPLRGYDIAQHLRQLRSDFEAFSTRQDEVAHRQLDSVRALIDQIQGLLRPSAGRDAHVNTEGGLSVRIIDAPPLDEGIRFGRVYQKSTSSRPPYSNPFRQRRSGQVRSWPQYGPGYQIRPLGLVPDDIYGQFRRWMATPGAYIEGETCRLTPPWISIVFEAGRWLEDGSALMVTYRGYVSRSLAEGTFYPNSDIKSFVTGRHSRLHRDWIQVDVVYLPVLLGGDHWVACEIHLPRREITIYDSLPSAHGDDDIKTAMQPLCIYIPHLLDQAGFYRYRPNVIHSLEPFTYIRPMQDIPHQRSDSGDCGIFTCMFIQYLGLGLPLSFGAEDSELMRTRVAVDLWAGQLL
ncbi:Phospholipase-like protein [Melia azedarach]|uniref:Phospholipase-like protein n=1 Tax=Melia azedarach TaxID=155640 RepID=A0ACC1XNR9_MELAZ|nr:Phospholipase-like protein [Melia azedarach]